MLTWGKARCALWCIVGIVLAGCETAGRRGATRVPDWQSEDPASPYAQVLVAPARQKVTPVPGPTLPLLPTNVQVPVVVAPVIDAHPTWVALASWCKNHDLRFSHRTSAGAPPAYLVQGSNGVLALRAGSLVASWQGVELRLGFRPQLIDGQLCLHWLDAQKTLLPLVQSNFTPSATNHVVVIDPGHGGEDAGTMSVASRAYEKDFTLDWARRLATLLNSAGWTVFLTRTNDTDVALSNRVHFAEQHHADIFVSLHFNSSAPDATQHGIETYCMTPAGMPSTVTRGFSDEVALAFPNNLFDTQNLALALSVHRAMLHTSGRHDRGIRRARFLGVLRNQSRPAILVEGGYLSNPGEARLIATPAHRQKLAEAVAQALGSVAAGLQAGAANVLPANSRLPDNAIGTNLWEQP